jgi:hypothetical protein
MTFGDTLATILKPSQKEEWRNCLQYLETLAFVRISLLSVMVLGEAQGTTPIQTADRNQDGSDGHVCSECAAEGLEQSLCLHQ